MEFPAYTDDAYWTDVIKQYIQNNYKHPEWYNIEYYILYVGILQELLEKE